MRLVTLSFVVLVSASTLATAQDAQPAGHTHGRAPSLGTIVFPNSGASAAQTPLLRGVALLHSFEYDAAATAFREAQAADPKFALAYWMEALTYSHVVWRIERLDASRAALKKLASSPAERLSRAGSDRERAFGAAVEAFYADAPLPRRARAYADSLRSMAWAWPDEQEPAAFAAHALMIDSYLSPEGSERDGKAREGIDLAQRVFRANRDHPGATHYLIHLYDSPAMAAQGLEFARIYDKVAPDAEHALHMPSHIYLQLGMWADVAASNERAWAASRAKNDPDWHGFSWLQYAYLQQGRWTEARGLIDSARAILSSARPRYGDANVIIPRLEFQYGAATGRWERALTPPSAPREGPMQERERGFRQLASYWAAVAAAHRGDVLLLQVAAPYLAIADSARAGTVRSRVQAANALVVHALVAMARGDRAAYLQSLEEAAAVERRFNQFVGPPERVFALEMLGGEYMAEKRYADAARAYLDVLRSAPGRSDALLGVVRARLALGDRAGVAESLTQLRTNWERADPDLRAVLERLGR